ncbi:MAG: hypothetical protein AAGF47_07645 [Planctomycetota bacterium]
MKNLVLIIVILGALGGAIFLFTQQGGSSMQARQEAGMRHYVDPTTLDSDNPSGVSLTVAEFKDRASSGNPLVAPNGSSDLVQAGVCPTDGKYYALVGHAQKPETCPHCETDLSGYDHDGNPL